MVAKMGKYLPDGVAGQKNISRKRRLIMKKLAAVTLLASLIAGPAMASMVLVDNFESYAVGQSLKNVNGWGNTRNSNFQPDLWDPENLLVADNGGNNVLALSDRDATTSHGGDLQLGISGAGTAIPTITGLGTIYMKIKISDNSNLALTTNGMDPAFCDGAAGCQGTSQWSSQASLAILEFAAQTGGTYAFRARDGGAYVNSPTSTIDTDLWMELWIQLDTVNQLARYYTRELGNYDLPVPMLDAGGSLDWGFRNTTYSSITTLKFNISPAPVWNCDNVPGGVDDPAIDNCVYYENLIDDIGVDTDTWSFCTVPEPASIAMIALGSILAIRRR